MFFGDLGIDFGPLSSWGQVIRGEESGFVTVYASGFVFEIGVGFIVAFDYS